MGGAEQAQWGWTFVPTQTQRPSAGACVHAFSQTTWVDLTLRARFFSGPRGKATEGP